MPDKPDISFSLWSIMKNSIGKDLSKIPIPVNFSEPLSFLQVNNAKLTVQLESLKFTFNVNVLTMYIF